MLGVYMPEKMQPRLDNRNTAKEFFRTVIDVIVQVEDSERRCVGDENIRAFRNICIMFGLAVSQSPMNIGTP